MKARYALAYAKSYGWHVSPLHNIDGGICSCTKEDCRSPGKHPRTEHGLKDATTNAQTIGAWWGLWPEANIGIATGPSGLAVIDVDGDKGEATIAALEDAHSPLEPVMEARTGGGGRHLVFAGSIQSGNGVLGECVDVKSDGGYIVVAPSDHLTGNTYKWTKKPQKGQKLELSPLPEWVRELRANPPKSDPAGRHDRLRNRIYSDVASGVPPDEALASAKASPDGVAVLREGRGLELDRMAHGPRIEQAAEAAGEEPDYQWNHEGFARRVYDTFGQRFRWCPINRTWWGWAGTHWKEEPRTSNKLIAPYIGLVKNSMIHEGDEQKKYALKHGNRGQIDGVLGCLREIESLNYPSTDYSTDPDLLNFKNGTLNLKTGELSPHSAAQNMGYCLDLEYDQSAEPLPELWRNFLATITEYDDDLHAYLQCAVGYSLTGHTREQAFFMLQGSGCNGKTTFMNCIRGILGPLQQNAAFDSFVRRATPQTRSDIAQFEGSRLVVCEEAGGWQRIDESRFKALTGDGEITARRLYGNEFSFRPRCKIWLATNDLPQVSETSDGIWRRMRVVPFHAKVEEIDQRLPDKLKAIEQSILAWAVQGARMWYDGGLGDPPRRVLEMTQDYRKGQDALGMFISDELVVGSDKEIETTDLYEKYCEWCKGEGRDRPMIRSTLIKLMKQRYDLEVRRSNGKRILIGIGTKSPWEED